LIVAPNTPAELIAFLQEHHIDFKFGKEKVGESLLESSRYNCLATDSHYFLRKGYTDVSVLVHCKDKDPVFLPQSYVRCSLFNLTKDNFITSDKGILKSLNATTLETFYFDPSKICIKEHAYGFLGGTVGKINDTLFFMGDIFKHSDGIALANYITQNNLKYVCLGNDYLYDGGGLFFVEKKNEQKELETT